MSKTFLKWWLTVIIQAAFFIVSLFYGYGEYILENDSTNLSIAIILVWIITSIYIGTKVYAIKESYEVQWFLAEQCMTLGMIGTVIGFLMMLGDSFTSIDVENTQAMRDTISTMAVGLSVALITTLNGLIASLFLKVQMIIIEHSDDTEA